MIKDNFNCPFCGFLYEEDFIEPLICKSFICDKCEGKIRVLLKDNGWVTLNKRNDRMAYFTRRTTREQDFKYLDRIRKKYIMRVKRRHNDGLLKDFFKQGNLMWTVKVRSMLCQEASMVGINITTIIKYFKANNGTINYRTVRAYKNNND